ncbi:MAG: hypothetical protein H0T53_08485 [Herpetosiphonaceae bacterium]|nr:hypothetical protein [Herpetosiphonaceae bacterium]
MATVPSDEMAQPQPDPRQSIPPQRVQIRCQNCQAPFAVPVWTYIDTGIMPELKSLMLSGQMNVAMCPNCGAGGMLATPLAYHDPAKKFFFTLFPQELNLGSAEEERFVGEATKVALETLPKEAPRGYILTPRRFITMQSLLETVLEGEGISKEVMQAQRARVEVLSQLAEALETDHAAGTLDTQEGKLAQAVEKHKTALDYDFFLTLTSYIDAALQQGRQESAEMLGQLRERVMTLSGFDPIAAGLQEPEVDDVVAALRDASDESLEETISNYRQVIDDAVFDAWAAQLATLPAAEQSAASARLEHVRSTIERMDAEAQAMFEAATELLREVMAAEDPRALLRERHKDISEAFMVVLDANISAAARAGQNEIAQHLSTVRQMTVEVMQELMTPQERLINQLLSVESPAEATKLLRKNIAQVNPEFVKQVNELAEQMEQAGRKEVVDRLRQVARESASLLF